jgi:hypothetical protein
MLAPVDCMGYRWRVGRGVTVEATLEGRALAAPRYRVEFRAYEFRTDVELLRQVPLTEVQAGDPWSGQGYVPAFTAPYGQMHFELVLVDTFAADPETVSEFREEVVQDWVGAVLDAPKP